MKRITIKDILRKKGKEPIACLTAYTKSISEILDKYCDVILVGDSVGMVLYGMKNTKEVKLETMILHAKTVKKYAKRSLVVFDMPYKSYPNKIIAYKNATKVIKITKCDAVKIEGGRKIAKIIKYLTEKGIPVMTTQDMKVYTRVKEGHQYVITCDVSRGKGLDYSAFSVIDVTSMPYRQVAVYRSNLVTPIEYADTILTTFTTQSLSYGTASARLSLVSHAPTLNLIKENPFECTPFEAKPIKRSPFFAKS